MGRRSNQWYPQAAVSFVSGSTADASYSATQTSKWGKMLLCLSPAPVPQTCSTKPRLAEGGTWVKCHGRGSPAAPTHFGGCLDVKVLTVLAHGCCIGVAYGHQQLHMMERQQLLTSKVNPRLFRALGCHFGEQQRCERHPKGPGSIKKTLYPILRQIRNLTFKMVKGHT